jgi:hypothetical protein
MDNLQMRDFETDNELSHGGNLEQRRSRIRSVLSSVPSRTDRAPTFAEVAPKASRLSDFSYNCTIRRALLSGESARIKERLQRKFHSQETHTLMFKPFARMHTGVNSDGTVALGIDPSSARGAAGAMFATELAALETPSQLMGSAMQMKKSASLPALRRGKMAPVGLPVN